MCPPWEELHITNFRLICCTTVQLVVWKPSRLLVCSTSVFGRGVRVIRDNSGGGSRNFYLSQILDD